LYQFQGLNTLIAAIKIPGSEFQTPVMTDTQ